MFSYKFPIAIVTTMALLRSPVVIAQDIAEVNNIARNISVKITGYGNGSGFIFDRQENTYFVLTNQHVVSEDSEYEIQTYDGTKHQVTNKQEIPDLDLAIIQFESTEEYEIPELGDSDELVEQQSVSVAGFPGEQTTIDIVPGNIRSIRQDIIQNPQEKKGYALIYTNPTLSGSSGGAVFDEEGRVIAINGESDRDPKNGRDISRGIPINLFLAAEEKLLATENNLSANTTSSDNIAGELIHTLTGHSDSVYSVAASGDKIVSASNDKTIKVWNLATGKLEQTLYSHDKGILSVAVSKGKIVSGSYDDTIKVWNLATGKLEQTLYGHHAWVQDIGLSEDKIVSYAGQDSTSSLDIPIKVWNLETGELEHMINNQRSPFCIEVNEEKIFSCSPDNTIKVWNLATGKLERTLITDHSDFVYSLAVSGDKIVSGSWDNTIKVWNLATGELERTLSGHSESVVSVAVSGDKIVSGSWDNTIKVWQLQQ